ncbi:MAG: hypothetical protein RIE06_11890 [Roseibium album]|uniref:Uncharacterized protein n=1 Tax=Roseibium album TaxID=311410 RepID=A0A0M7AT74_9HYPH|nr:MULTISPECIES: hypothetical protein [Stappiaceae]MBG6156404.1 hypothetical protein [Labrenzia sp. EL_162]MBG6164739.1 hypothetical protein [Labrenzia sp. EL_195]MBG6173573.1 hypothetical protein [Labrenzia sp. EL_132]MBG6195656.1 hypothetical protein [Labrenzia sp. EL_159]MBG6202161.1 hypothetical protein [Labrenzia sp. EL_13]MBG6208505.1 hypothetical protein [Labrenzia sp. EL_126]MBG6227657.1 hypothetical protein [Labrenzia sp. EL_208]MCR9060715.1 hypothetical protein [Paracoccaceae bact
MSEMQDNVVPHTRIRSLRDAIRKVQLGEVERSDVVVELQDTERARLDMLADELKDVFKEIPEDDDQFSLQIISGSTPRLWIDATSHVAVGGDRKTYRFLKDTRLGRVVILETANIDDMADCLTEYIAERVIEREKALEGDWLNSRLKEVAQESRVVRVRESRTSWLAVAGAFGIGIAAGVIGLIAFAWFANPI